MISDTYIVMDGLLLLSERQMARKIAEFPAVAWGSRVDGRRILSGLLYVIRNGFGGKHDGRLDPHKTLNNRFIRWSRFGGFRGIIAGRAGEWPNPSGIMWTQRI